MLCCQSEIDVNKKSRKSRGKYIDNLKFEANNYVHSLLQDIDSKLRKSPLHENYTLQSDSENLMTRYFYYPRILDESSYNTVKNSYIKPRVVLEFGCLGGDAPVETKSIESYVDQYLSAKLNEPKKTIEIVAMCAKRTFWEKITALHAEASNTKKSMGEYFSRHYVDVYTIIKSGIVEQINLDLLHKVVKDKMLYFTSKSANYEVIAEGKLKLIPEDEKLEVLIDDYKKMGIMLYNDSDSFDEIKKVITTFQNTVNKKINFQIS